MRRIVDGLNRPKSLPSESTKQNLQRTYSKRLNSTRRQTTGNKTKLSNASNQQEKMSISKNESNRMKRPRKTRLDIPNSHNIVKQGAMSPGNEVFVGKVNNLEEHVALRLEICELYRADFSAIERSIIKIQAWWRSRKTRQNFIEYRFSVVKCQKFIRKRIIRRKILNEITTRVAFRRERNKAAFIIQDAWKSHVQYKRLKSAVMLCQNMYRSKLLSRKLMKLKAVTRLQSWWRGCICYRRYQKLRFYSQKIQTRYRYRRLKAASIKIQSFYRMYSAKKYYINLKTSALTIGRFYRQSRKYRFLRNAYTTIISLRCLFRTGRKDNLSFPLLQKNQVDILVNMILHDKLAAFQAYCRGFIHRHNDKSIKSKIVRKNYAESESSNDINAVQISHSQNTANSDAIDTISRSDRINGSNKLSVENEEETMDFAQIVLSNLSKLSPPELRALTEWNTSVNSKYKSNLKVEVVHKEGPKPESPNAKTLAKFAVKAREEAEEYLPGSKIKWKSDDSLAISLLSQPPSSPNRNKPPVKSILKKTPALKASKSKSPQDQSQSSTVTIQRIMYQENKRRLTSIRPPSRQNKKLKSAKSPLKPPKKTPTKR